MSLDVLPPFLVSVADLLAGKDDLFFPDNGILRR
jgi:hypothetical protein